jgi:hypothetical protein
VKPRVHKISVTEYYENDLSSVDDVDSAIRRYSQRPNVPVAIELMRVEARARMTGILLEQIERFVESLLDASRK